MIYIKLYTNEFTSINEIQEMECNGYEPIQTTPNFLIKGKFQFSVVPPLRGVYLITTTGDFIRSIPYNIDPPDGESKVTLSFTP